MNLPNGDQALVDPGKLVDYCLDPLHKDGRHKARVFRSALGIGQTNWQELAQQLLRAARAEQASIYRITEIGILYQLDFLAHGPREEVPWYDRDGSS